MYKWNNKRRRIKVAEEIFELIMAENFSKLMTEYKTAHPGSLENIKKK